MVDVPDGGDPLESLRQEVGERLQLLDALALRGLDQQEQIIETAEVGERGAKRVDAAVMAGQEAQNVAVEGQPAAEEEGDHDQKQRDQEDPTILPPGEVPYPEEKPLLDARLHRPAARLVPGLRIPFSTAGRPTPGCRASPPSPGPR